MRILVDIGHPAHVHFFKHAIRRLAAEGHEVRISARAKDVTTALLDLHGFEYRILSTLRGGRWGMAREYLERLIALIRLIREFRPEVITAIGGIFIAPAGRLTGVPSVVFTDTEHVSLDRYLSNPWATRICTPTAFKRDLGPRHERYEGLHELAYLHPDHFRPDPGIRAELGLEPDQRFALLRFVSWQASHDVGQSGFSAELKERAIERLSRHLPVFVCSEGHPPPSLERYQPPVPPHRLHDVIAAAALYFGEGATMATEAALLGTPSVYLSSLVGTMGNFELLEAEQLVLAFRDGEHALDEAEKLLGDPTTQSRWRKRAGELVARLIDVTEFIHDQLLENGGGACAQTGR